MRPERRASSCAGGAGSRTRPTASSDLDPERTLSVLADAGDLDLTFCPSGTQGFRDLRRDAIAIGAAGQEKNRLALPRLRRLLDRLREREQ